MTRRPYQDKWRDGKLVEAGRRDCAGRYAAIHKAIADRFARQVTVADVGGWDGYFSRRLAEAGHSVTLVEQRTVPDLDGTGIVHRRMVVDASNVDQIGHHDVILALAVLHHMDDWAEVYDKLKAQCRLLILELAHPDEAGTARVAGAARNTGPAFERVMGDDPVVLTETAGPNGVARPIVMVRTAAWGPMVDGTGQAGPIISTSDFGALGYQPHPGTLNIEVGREGRDWLTRQPHITIPSSRSDDRYVPATANGIECHASFQRGRSIVELLAPVRLRDTLTDPVVVAPVGAHSAR